MSSFKSDTSTLLLAVEEERERGGTEVDLTLTPKAAGVREEDTGLSKQLREAEGTWRNRSRSPSVRADAFLSNSRVRRQKEFAQVMRDATQYAALRDFAESVHSEENFMFLESLGALESLAVGTPVVRGASRGVSAALERFAKGDQDPSTPAAEEAVEVSDEVAVLFRKFFETYIADTAPCQVNIPDSVKRQITERVGGSARLRSSIFDTAADEVMAMVYRDTYQKFVGRGSGGGMLAKKGSMATLCIAGGEDSEWGESAASPPATPTTTRVAGQWGGLAGGGDAAGATAGREKGKAVRAVKRLLSRFQPAAMRPSSVAAETE
ncbi:hypothetical protein HDU67_003658 [Dinochytrium kinnereticum]|nr:hypothetical protein HDU67_003658 [Dinochytrium kinnereticum]